METGPSRRWSGPVFRFTRVLLARRLLSRGALGGLGGISALSGRLRAPGDDERHGSHGEEKRKHLLHSVIDLLVESLTDRFVEAHRRRLLYHSIDDGVAGELEPDLPKVPAELPDHRPDE